MFEKVGLGFPVDAEHCESVKDKDAAASNKEAEPKARNAVIQTKGKMISNRNRNQIVSHEVGRSSHPLFGTSTKDARDHGLSSINQLFAIARLPFDRRLVSVDFIRFFFDRREKEKGAKVSHQKAAHDGKGVRSQSNGGDVSREDLDDLETQKDHCSANE